MKTNKIFKETKGVFVPPQKVYYFGKLKHGSPYFYPRNFNSTIISVRKLKLKSKEDLYKQNEKYPHLKNNRENRFSNLPMVRRAKHFTKKIFGNYYFIELGWPISIKSNTLGWKDKFNSPRFEWSPGFYIYFFKLQFCIWWTAPLLEGEKYPNNNKYYEMMLQYLKYTYKDIKKAEKEWGWIDSETKKTTWNKNYLVN